MIETTKPSAAVNFDTAISFIKSIGISVEFESIEGACFLPGISISGGKIIIDMQKLKYPGDVLHEAAHIAIVPAADRSSLNQDSIAARQHREAEEMMAIAWSFAACIHLGIDASFVFHDDGYNGGGTSIAENFKEGRYFGVAMLQWVGMAQEKKDEMEPHKPVYPLMLQWLRN